MALKKLSKSYGTSYAGLTASLRDGSGSPARCYAAATGGLSHSDGNFVLDATGGFTTFVDDGRLYVLSAYGSTSTPVFTDLNLEVDDASDFTQTQVEKLVSLADSISGTVSGGGESSTADKLRINGSPGTYGTVICRWDQATSFTSDAVRAYKSIDDRTTPASLLAGCPDPANRNSATIVGNGSTFVYYQEIMSANVDATTVRTVGVWVRGRVRADGGPVHEVRVVLAADNGSLTAPNLSVRYAQASFSVPADGKWHFHVIPATAGAGWLTTYADAFIPGTGTVYRWVRVAMETGTAASPHGDPTAGSTADFGAIYINPRGTKSAAIVRFDDCKNGFLDQMGSYWSTAFPSGFTTGRSGVSISSVAGQAMSPMQLIAAFGLVANHFILTRHVGLPGFASWAELKTYESTYGHKVCFQSHANPTSNHGHGVTLLGPLGYNIGPAGSISAISGSLLTWSSHPATAGTTNVSFGPQGFPVQFVAGSGRPAAVASGQCVWLRHVDANTISVHPTEQDAGSNLNAIDFTGATAASLQIRYWGSTNDGSAILQDYITGRNLLQANGLSGYRYYAPNQSAWDLYVEQAVRTVGFDGVWGGGAAVDWFQPSFAMWSSVKQSTTAAHAWRVRVDPSLVTTMAAVGTDGLSTNESAIRNAVRAFVKEGAVFQNIMHVITDPNQIQTLVWYMDELKYWSDAGMVYVDTVDKVSAAVVANRI